MLVWSATHLGVKVPADEKEAVPPRLDIKPPGVHAPNKSVVSIFGKGFSRIGGALLPRAR